MGNPSCLLYLVDVASSMCYLVDFGSTYSILPHKSSAEPTGPRLMTADCKPLHCWGRRTCSIRTHTRESSWTFLLAPMAFPILGADFLSNSRLLVDISNNRLVARGSKAAVVTGVVAASPLWSSLLLHIPQWRHSSAPPAAIWHSRAARKPKAMTAAPPQAVPPSTPSLPTVLRHPAPAVAHQGSGGPACT